MKKLLLSLFVILLTSVLRAQSWEGDNRDTSRVQLLKGLEYTGVAREFLERENSFVAEC